MTTPTGKLAWGQAAVYDAVDDRAVIAAVTRNRLGLVWPANVTPGSGLQLILEGGWLGVASCGDRTSAVVGSRLDQVIMANPGPATGAPRLDWLWCDTEPDEGTWSLVVIPRSEAVGRAGIPLAFITCPANSTTAAEMTIASVGAELERRLMAYDSRNDARVASGVTWETADTIAWSACLAEPGQWYKARFTANSPMALTGTLEGRIGIGRRLTGGTEASSVLSRASAISYPRLNAPTAADVEYIFRHPTNSPVTDYTYIGRIWAAGNGTYRVNLITNQGPGLQLTVEDIGS
jgi:hypothetical protein